MAHSTATADLSDSSVMGDSRLAAVSRAALGVGVAGLLATAWIGWNRADPAQFAKIYLVNFMFVLALCLGSLQFTLIQHLVRAGWSVVVRRVAESIAANLTWIWILFLPVAWLYFSKPHFGDHGPSGLGLVWPWADMEWMRSHDAAEAAIVDKKAAYLNPNFFMIRTVAYFLIWGGTAAWLLRTSRTQDATGSAALTQRMGKWAGPLIILYGLSITFAAFDWMMSLSPTWFSTMFGVYFFCCVSTAGFSFLAFVVLRMQHMGYLRNVVTPEHYQDLGKLIFAFGVVFWAYIAYSQYMLIWYANIPEETTFFLARQVGGWTWLSAILLVGHFMIPFVLLISRWIKRWRLTLALGAVWMAAFAWLDLWYLIMPPVPTKLATYDSYSAFAEANAGASTGLFDPLPYTMLVGMMGLLVWSTASRLSRGAVLCRRDPRLPESLRFENI